MARTVPGPGSPVVRKGHVGGDRRCSGDGEGVGEGEEVWEKGMENDEGVMCISTSSPEHM